MPSSQRAQQLHALAGIGSAASRPLDSPFAVAPFPLRMAVSNPSHLAVSIIAPERRDDFPAVIGRIGTALYPTDSTPTVGGLPGPWRGKAAREGLRYARRAVVYPPLRLPDLAAAQGAPPAMRGLMYLPWLMIYWFPSSGLGTSREASASRNSSHVGTWKRINQQLIGSSEHAFLPPFDNSPCLEAVTVFARNRARASWPRPCHIEVMRA